MVRVSRKWIDCNVELVKYQRDSIKGILVHGTMKVPSGGFETDLRAEEVTDIDFGRISKDFRINVPGYGWCDAFSYPADREVNRNRSSRSVPRSAYSFKVSKSIRK